MGSLPADALSLHHLSRSSTVLRPSSSLPFFSRPADRPSCPLIRRRSIGLSLSTSSRIAASGRNGALVSRSVQLKDGVYAVGDFMTKKEDLVVVKPSTSVDEALEKIVEHRISGFPVINDDWTLAGVVSDYDLLALDSISGHGSTDTSIFPEVDSTWKAFNEIQKLLSKTNGKIVGEVMTPAPFVIQETTNLEDAVRLLLETKYR